jgi:hypothetical protein
MLRSFRLTNHRSFAAEQELSLLPVYDRDQAALPVAAIYGANASGKSNLLDGLAFMRDAVLNSFQRWDAEGGVPNHPFRLNPDLRTEPSGYVVDVAIGGLRYTYGFTANDERVLEEWLYSYPQKKKRVVFERSKDEIRFGSTLGGARPKLDLVRELTRRNALFLSVSVQSDVYEVMPIYHWFRAGIALRSAEHSVSELAAASRVQRYVRDDPERQQVIVDLLATADVGIADLQIVDEKVVRERAAGLDPQKRERAMPKLFFEHSGSNEMFSFAEESAGTRSWLSLLPYALDALENGAAIVIDEIDASLHPLLTARLIGLFREAKTNPHGAQLIFTTHDASLLGTALGEEVLARDQIWFVEKDRGGASRLYPLSDFKPREGENRERRYLGGSYGAVPVVSATRFADAVREG